MAILSASQIRDAVANFIPESIQNNIFVKSLLAGATAIGILLSVPAFAPVGAIGATGWIIVYIVVGGTFSVEAVSRAWDSWRNQSESEREEVDTELKALKESLDNGDITEQEYMEGAKGLLDKMFD